MTRRRDDGREGDEDKSKSMTMTMTTAPIPPGNTNPIKDHDDASKRHFDVYAAYQHALTDDDVSLLFYLKCPFSSQNSDIAPTSRNSISHGPRHILRW